jgi:tetratricopeptide (TPR) repeat protein
MAGGAERSEPHAVVDDGLLAAAVLGGGLPEEAEMHLALAGQSYHRSEIAEQHLRAAETIAPDHAAVLIGFYRFYFYKGRLAEALTVAERCLAKSARDNGFAVDWRAVGAQDAEFGRFDNALARFYLFTLKGYAYLQMRLGNLAEGGAAVAKLIELDPTDKVGARVLLEVLERAERGDDD